MYINICNTTLLSFSHKLIYRFRIILAEDIEQITNLDQVMKAYVTGGLFDIVLKVVAK